MAFRFFLQPGEQPNSSIGAVFSALFVFFIFQNRKQMMNKLSQQWDVQKTFKNDPRWDPNIAKIAQTRTNVAQMAKQLHNIAQMDQHGPDCPNGL